LVAVCGLLLGIGILTGVNGLFRHGDRLLSKKQKTVQTEVAFGPHRCTLPYHRSCLGSEPEFWEQQCKPGRV
jgi:hypothetical protein